MKSLGLHVNRLRMVLPLTAGLCFGLALARALWETWPAAFLVLDQTTGLRWVLGCAGALTFWAVWRWGPLSLRAADFGPFYLLLIGLAAPDVNVLRLWTLIVGAILLAGALALRRRRPAALAALVTGAGAFAVYLLTLGQYVGEADTFEFQVTAPVLGVAHPTGYPLYTLVGKLCSLVPIGSMAWRVNLASAIPAALAILVLAEVMRRLQVGRLLAALAALTLAFSATFWSQAVAAEVYALNALFVVVILGILIDGLYVTAPRFGGRGEVRARSVWTLFLAFGLGLTNHLTLVLLIPAAALALWYCRPRLTRRQWAVAFGLFGAGLLVYLYIPLRWPALHDGEAMPLGDFLAWVTGQRFGGALMLEYWSQPDRWLTIGRMILDQFGALGLILGVAGLARLARWFPEMGIVTLAAYGAHFFYALVYIVPDIEVFLIPMHIIQVIWMAYAVHALGEWGGKLVRGIAQERLYVSLHVAAALMPLTLLWVNGATVDPARGREAEEWGQYVLSLPLDEGAAVLADGEKIAPLEYLHRIEGLRPDMEIIVLGNEALYRAVLAERLAAGQTVYLARYLPGLEGVYHLRSVGPLVEVGTAPLTEPPAGMTEVGATFCGWARLLGYRVESTSVRIGQVGRLTLYWRRDGESTGRYQVRLRLIDRDGTVAWEERDRFAVSNMYPANAWKDGEVIPDYHEVAFEHGMLPGTYRLEVALFEPFAAVGLPVTDDSRWGNPQGCLQTSGGAVCRTVSTWVAVARFEVALAEEIPRSSVEVRCRLSDSLLLMGYDAPVSATEGREVPVKLHFLALEDVERGSIELGELEGIEWAIRSSEDLPLLRGGENLVMEVRPLAEAPLAQYRVIVSPSSREAFDLPPIPVWPAGAEALANFDGRVLLLDGGQSATTMQPGDLLDVYLVWQPLQRLDEDYTVFVHLLGPDGVLHGQTDAHPVQGTYPTSQWQVGEQIEDGYQVRLLDDAPPGAYQIEVGLYLLATSERLPVVDTTGVPVDNRHILGTIEVAGR